MISLKNFKVKLLNARMFMRLIVLFFLGLYLFEARLAVAAAAASSAAEPVDYKDVYKRNLVALRWGLTPFMLHADPNTSCVEEYSLSSGEKRKIISLDVWSKIKLHIVNKDKKSKKVGSAKGKRRSSYTETGLGRTMHHTLQTAEEVRARGEATGVPFRALILAIIIELNGFFEVSEKYHKAREWYKKILDIPGLQTMEQVERNIRRESRDPVEGPAEEDLPEVAKGGGSVEEDRGLSAPEVKVAVSGLVEEAEEDDDFPSLFYGAVAAGGAVLELSNKKHLFQKLGWHLPDHLQSVLM